MSSLKDSFTEATAARDIQALEAIFRETPDVQKLCEQTNYTPTDLLPWATLANNVNSIKACLEQGASLTPEVEANAQVMAGLEAYHLLVPAGLDVNRDFGYAGTTLTQAIAASDKDLVAYLLQAGANPNIGSLNGSSTLELAINESLPVSVVKQLIDHGAEFPTKGLVLLGVLAGNVEMVKFLAEAGANVNETSDDSFVTEHRGKKLSALHLAVLESSVDMVEELLRDGADRTVKDANGKTPLDLANEGGQTESVTLLQ